MMTLLHNTEYIELNRKHCLELIVFLSDNSDIFDITVNKSAITFEPHLPKSIYETFGEFILFTLTNYTLESLKIYPEYITFETGFGAENFGATCKVSIDGIFQLSKNNSILFINPHATIEKDFFSEKFNKEEQMKRSMKAFSFKK